MALFFVCVKMHEKPLEQALELLQKEDPGLQVSADAETGQTVIAGMGELHLEITLERIRSDFGVDARLGPFQVAYKETLTEPVADTYVLDRNLGALLDCFQFDLAATRYQSVGVSSR